MEFKCRTVLKLKINKKNGLKVKLLEDKQSVFSLLGDKKTLSLGEFDKSKTYLFF